MNRGRELGLHAAGWGFPNATAASAAYIKLGGDLRRAPYYNKPGHAQIDGGAKVELLVGKREPQDDGSVPIERARAHSRMAAASLSSGVQGLRRP